LKNKNLVICVVFILFLLGGNNYSYAQTTDSKLANHYFNKGEFDKAEVYYLKLYKRDKSKGYFIKYFECLMYQEKYIEAEKVSKKQIKRETFEIEYQFRLAEVYEKTDRQNEADNIYKGLIKNLAPIQSQVSNLGKSFSNKIKFDFALDTYLKGKKIIKQGYQFNIELAKLYSAKNEPRLMINEYLNLIDYSYSYKRSVQNYLSRAIDFEVEEDKIQILKEELLIRIQKDPMNQHFSEMLIWMYLQRKQFSSAVVQAKALDKRLDLKGKKVYEIGNVCKSNKSYSNARKAYQYVISLGQGKPYHKLAIQNNLEVSFLEVTTKSNYSKEELNKTIVDFETALTQLGNTQQSFSIIKQLATIYAFYVNRPKDAENLLDKVLTKQMSLKQKSEFKVLLGDIYVVDDKIWDASLLYMQVAKEMSEDPIGHEAKFKNAKVFYYDGEFEYAKAQLDVLKASTTKLIANDAMQLYLLLQDNLGVDTAVVPVQMFANADLLLQQHKYSEALVELDSISKLFPFHGLADNILFKKAEIYQKQQNWTKAITFYDIVVKSYGFDILGDDAAINIARIYDKNLNNPAKAKVYYKKILFEFSASLYSEEARKRFREIKDELPSNKEEVIENN
jgi:tetratricopeptide (TPR) repeat protein